MSKKFLSQLGNILILLISFALPIALIIYFRNDFKTIEKIIPTTGIAGPLFSILLMGVLSATPIPTDPIVILNGAIFGPFIGVLVSWMGNNLAAIIEYFIGQGIARIADFDKKRHSLPFGLGDFPADSAWYLICGRFVPQFGGKVVSISSGMYHVNFWKYLWTSVVSNLVGSVLLAVGGYSILHNLL